MIKGQSIASCFMALLAGACSVNPGDPAADTAMVTPSSVDVGAGPFGQAEQTSPEAAEPAAGPGPPGTTETTSAETPAEPTPAPSSHVALKYLIGDIDPASDPKFARIPEKYIGGSRVWGHKDAVEAFVRMAEDAEQNGYKLKIVSAFRSFSDQKKIWEDKWTGKTLVGGKKLNVSTPDPDARALKILQYSSMPGTSRHHWGTDFDINSLENSYFTNNRDGKRIYDWLVGHAANYGFCQVYTSKSGESGRSTGYEEEKWHWSYRPVAAWYLKQYPVDVGYERLTGFLGAETAADIDVIPNYVQGINPECMQ